MCDFHGAGRLIGHNAQGNFGDGGIFVAIEEYRPARLDRDECRLLLMHGCGIET